MPVNLPSSLGLSICLGQGGALLLSSAAVSRERACLCCCACPVLRFWAHLRFPPPPRLYYLSAVQDVASRVPSVKIYMCLYLCNLKIKAGMSSTQQLPGAHSVGAQGHTYPNPYQDNLYLLSGVL